MVSLPAIVSVNLVRSLSKAEAFFSCILFGIPRGGVLEFVADLANTSCNLNFLT